MPINLPNFIGPVDKPDYSGFENLTKNFLESYHAPQRLKEERAAAKRLKEAEELAHHFKRTYGPREHEADIALKLAKTQFYQNPLTPEGREIQHVFGENPELFKQLIQQKHERGTPASANSVIMKALNDRQKIGEEFGEDSPQARIADAYLNKLTSVGGQGALGGVTSPVRTKEMTAQIANEARNFMTHHLEMPKEYLGLGGSARFANDILKYKSTKDPKLKKQLAERMANAANAEKLAPEFGMYQLQSFGQTPTVSAQKQQEKAIKQGWPSFGHALIESMPSEVQQLTNQKHAESIEALKDLRSKSFGNLLRGGKGSEAIRGLENFQTENFPYQDFGGITDEDLEYIANQNNSSVEDVKKWMGIE